jgi:hypothetical protein
VIGIDDASTVNGFTIDQNLRKADTVEFNRVITPRVDNGGSALQLNPAGGNVSIGTTRADEKFNIGGGIQLEGTSTKSIYSYNRTGGAYTGLNLDGLYVDLFTNGTQRMRVADSGNVLIGTTTQISNAKLVIDPGAGAHALTFKSNSAYMSAFNDDGTQRSGFIQFNHGSNLEIQGEKTGGQVPIVLNQNGGNVLIGTGADDGVGRLQVAGIANIRSNGEQIVNAISSAVTNVFYTFQNSSQKYLLGIRVAAGNTFQLLDSTSGAVLTEVTPAGYTRLGADAGAPAIKMKKLTGTTGATQGDTVSVAHGLTVSKIISVTGMVFYSATDFVTQAYRTNSTGFEFLVSGDSTTIDVTTVPGNSANILSKSFTCLLTYEE